jgi:hypothetical protein
MVSATVHAPHEAISVREQRSERKATIPEGDDMSRVSGVSLRTIPGAERLVELHGAELPQKDELCGAFWGTLALRLAGVTDGGTPVDQDRVAALAGSALSPRAQDDLPPGEPGRSDYRISLPTAEDPAVAGTSAGGLVRALQELAGDALAVIPVAGPWTPEAVTAVLNAADEAGGPCTVIANLATGHLWGSRPSPAAVLGYLIGGDQNAGPPPDWNVGHFVGLLGRIEGPGGTLILVGDTYRSLGWEGIHAQPVERLSDALARTGSERPSGVILLAPATDAAELKRRIGAAGLQLGAWDNGSIDVAARGR